VATFDDLFGKKSGGKYMKWDAVGDTIIVQFLGEPDPTSPQKDFKSGEKKFMVQVEDGGKWGPKQESQFDPESVHSFFPLTQISIRVRVVAYKNAKGEAREDFEPFETTWELNQNQEEKFKESMMEDRDLQVGAGTIAGIKWIDDSKPRKYAIKLKAGE
jgi:hypothetical protein